MAILFRLARLAMNPLFAILPPRRRFGMAMRLARIVAPIAGRLVSRHLRILNDGVAIALWLMTLSMRQGGITFDIPIEVEGEEVVADARRRGRGLLLVTGHFTLNTMPVPWLRARGWHVHTVRSEFDDALIVPGTRDPLPHFVPSANMLVAIRTALRDGDAVILPVDSLQPLPNGFTIGPLHVSDSALRFAERCGTSVAYLETRASRRGVAATFTRGDLRSTFVRWLVAGVK